MSRDRAAIFIGLCDLLMCVLAVVITAVAPTKAKTDGVKPKAEYLIQMTYDVSRDVDLDLWVVGPTRKPVFYGSRQVGCADLERDSLGFNTQVVILADGTTVHAKENVETTSLRCIENGRWDVAVNNFSYHIGDRGEPITAHIEVMGINPNLRVVWAGDVTLNHLGETVNAVSFDLNADGQIKLASVPLEPLTSAYERSKAGGTP